MMRWCRRRLDTVAGLLTVVAGCAASALTVCGNSHGNDASIARACGPTQPCPSPGERCVWLPAEGRGYCAPACGDGGTCPEGRQCRQVAPGECFPCRVVSEACIVPDGGP